MEYFIYLYTDHQSQSVWLDYIFPTTGGEHGPQPNLDSYPHICFMHGTTLCFPTVTHHLQYCWFYQWLLHTSRWHWMVVRKNKFLFLCLPVMKSLSPGLYKCCRISKLWDDFTYAITMFIQKNTTFEQTLHLNKFHFWYVAKWNNHYVWISAMAVMVQTHE